MGAIPERIAAYRLLEKLGEGGMGVVYRAEQLEPVRREVALKLLKTAHETDRVVARFESERQALAIMEHPGIARVFDAGVAEDGRPWFAMELVRGTPIVKYCDERRLSVRDRVRIFAGVCRALQHAHQKGVIHRDVKPSNILVTESDGSPLCKVIDFGIARATEPSADSAQLTATHEWLGTPMYMSPEQLTEGEYLDTRTDIYSLGAVLYELLVGAMPFDASAYSGLSVFSTVLARDTTPPPVRVRQLGDAAAQVAHARRTDLPSLARELNGDLRWILLRALERERDRRYETAGEFAFDLERYLANSPISARPPSAAYRTRKFIRRHPAGVAFAAVLVLLLAGVALLQTVQAARIALARDDAQLRQEQAEDLLGFMVGDLRQKLQPIGRLDLLDDVGERAMGYFSAIDEDMLSDGERHRRAQMLMQLGQVRVSQGNLPDALGLFRQAAAIGGSIAQAPTARGEWLKSLGEAHFWIANVHRMQGDLDEALTGFEAYRTVAEDLVLREPENLEWQMELAMSNSNVGAIAYSRRDLPRAEDAFRRRLDLQFRQIAADTGNATRRTELSTVHNFLGAILEESGDLAGALEQYRADLAVREDLLRREPDNMPWQARLAVTLSYLGGLHGAIGNADSALHYYRAGYELESRLVRHDPANGAWRRGHAVAGAQLGRVLLEAGAVAESAQLIAAARLSLEQLLAENPAQRGWRIALAHRHVDEANLQLARRSPGAAATAAGRALSVLDSLLAAGPTDRDVARPAALALLARGQARLAAGDADGAGADWRRSAELLAPLAATSREWLILDPWCRALMLLNRHADAAAAIRTLDEIGYHDAAFRRLAAGQSRSTQ